MADLYVLTTMSIGAGGTIAILCGPMAQLRRDNFRSDIRRIRDDLFDFMWRHGYSYDTPAYRYAREALNGILRASNHITPFVMALAILWMLRRAKRPSGWSVPEYGCDERLRKKVIDALNEATQRLLEFVFFEGLIGRGVRVLLFFATMRTRASEIQRRAERAARAFLEESARTVLHGAGS